MATAVDKIDQMTSERIEQLRDALETMTDHDAIRFAQGQAAAFREIQAFLDRMRRPKGRSTSNDVEMSP